jgi:hypothetical protein
MITEINKNILSVDHGLICHQTNCIGAMGGLAGAIAQKWPMVGEQYFDLITNNRKNLWKLLGTFQNVVVSDNLRVLNIFGQYDINSSERRTEYGSIAQAFNAIANTVFIRDGIISIDSFFTGDEKVKNTINDVYIPFNFGSGLGGGNWSIVLEIITDCFKNSDKNVYICKI